MARRLSPEFWPNHRERHSKKPGPPMIFCSKLLSILLIYNSLMADEQGAYGTICRAFGVYLCTPCGR